VTGTQSAAVLLEDASLNQVEGADGWRARRRLCSCGSAEATQHERYTEIPEPHLHPSAVCCGRRSAPEHAQSNLSTLKRTTTAGCNGENQKADQDHVKSCPSTGSRALPSSSGHAGLDTRLIAVRKAFSPVLNRFRRIAATTAALILIGVRSQSSAAPAGDGHAVDPVEAERFHPIGPPLTKLGVKLADPNWIVAWLLHPSRVRPHKLMRTLRVRANEARVLAGYLYAGAPPERVDAKWQGGDVRVGEQLFVSRGCRGCHTVGSAEPSPLTRAPDLAGIGVKVRPQWLFDWIKSPRSYDPNTAMPQLALSDDDIRHLVAFLMSHREGAGLVAAAPRAQPDAPAEQARATIARFNCPKCHLVTGFQKIEPTTRWAAVPEGCADCHQSSEASMAAGVMPISDGPDALALENGRMLVAYYNCRGCHRIEGRGGVIAEHLERKTFAPPALDGEGARVQTSWLIEFLQRPTNLRPWLQMRMPTYGLSPAEATAVARYLAVLARAPAADEPQAGMSDQTAAVGRRRLAHFKCVQCHSTGGDTEPCTVDAEDLSIDLMLVKRRLRPSWVRDFLARPKAVMGTETRMPAVFYTTDGVPKVEHPEDDIAAITAYLFRMTEPPHADRDSEGPKQPPPIDWSVYPY
jgi:mono/diheme cytochrome c family protein